MPNTLARSARVWLPLLIVGIATSIALLQPVPTAPPSANQGWLHWWMYPIAPDPRARLTNMSADLQTIYAISSGSKSQVWVAGNAGLIGFSPDYGSTWQKLTTADFCSAKGAAPSADIIALYFFNHRDGWLVTRGDYTFETKDGGCTWTPRWNHEHNLLSAFRRGEPHLLVTTLNDVIARGNEGRDQLSQQATSLHKSHIPGVHRVFVTSRPPAIAVGINGQLWHIGGKELSPEVVSTSSAPSENLRGIFSTDDDVLGVDLWVCGTAGSIYHRHGDAGFWTRQVTSTANTLNDIFFINHKEGWAVGDEGTILHTADAGETWIDQTQGSLHPLPTVAYVAPWYYLTWLLCLTPLWVWPSAEARINGGVAPFLLPDKPVRDLDSDAVPFGPLVERLQRILSNTATYPPQTIALNGISGSGRTTALGLLRSALAGSGATTVWLNATHHQHDGNVLASMLERIRAQAVPPIWTIRGASFYLTLFRMRATAVFLAAMLAAVVVAVVLGAILRAESIGLVSLIAVAAGTVWATYLKVIAFPIRPGKVLASIKGAAGIRDVQQRAVIRYRTGDELERFSSAMAAPVTIFVDDLDHCTPESLPQVLDAIHFLASRMRCFIILAVDTTHGSGSLASPVGHVRAEPLTAPPEGISDDDWLRTSRRVLAHDWFQKAVNLILPIPSPDATSVARLAQPTSDVASAGTAFRMRPADYFAATAVFVLLLYSAVRIGGTAEAQLGLVAAVQKIFHGKDPSSTGRKEPPENIVANQLQRNIHADDRQHVIPLEHPGQTGSITLRAGVRTRLPWQSFIALFSLLCIAIRANSRRATITTPDPSGTLDVALARCEYIIRLACHTPRAIKRFINYARLLAGLRGEVEGAASIPDDALIALAALNELRLQAREGDIAAFSTALVQVDLQEDVLHKYDAVFRKLRESVSAMG